MQKNNTPLNHLELLYEMNRLFLSFLQTRARRDQDCFELPAQVRTALSEASDEQLDRAAALPHALFRLHLEASRAADAPPERSTPEAIGVYCLQISLLQSARELCRQNAHLAQTFLNLPATDLIRLRCLALIELTGLAENAHLVTAGFAGEPWLWQKMLSPNAASEQRSLRLIALQPRAADMLSSRPGAAMRMH